MTGYRPGRRRHCRQTDGIPSTLIDWPLSHHYGTVYLQSAGYGFRQARKCASSDELHAKPSPSTLKLPLHSSVWKGEVRIISGPFGKAGYLLLPLSKTELALF